MSKKNNRITSEKAPRINVSILKDHHSKLHVLKNKEQRLLEVVTDKVLEVGIREYKEENP